MTNLDKLHKGAYIFKTIIGVCVFGMFLTTMIASVYTLSFIKENHELENNYNDCMSSLEEEISK